MPAKIDLTNQTFGKLKVVEPAPSKNGKTYWKCQCECGNFTIVQTGHLRTQKVRSCGCLKTIRPHGDLNLGFKKCALCGKIFNSNNYKRNYCYECSPKGLDSAKRLRFLKRKIKHLLIEYKRGKCEKCGYNKHEAALQFHHKDPSKKEFSLSQVNLNSEFTIEKMKVEVDKCALLCANCHMIEHFKLDNFDL